jgi:CBS domain-containing protein
MVDAGSPPLWIPADPALQLWKGRSMATVREILCVKGPKVHFVCPDATVLEAAQLMNEHKIGSLAVMDGEPLAGIITERDILSRVVAQRLDPSETRVRDVMTTEVVCGRPYTTIEEARGVMKNRRLRHLPIVDDDNRLCGMISIGDLNAHETNSKEMTIHMLEEYIHGYV